MSARRICFTEREAFTVAWALAEGLAHAVAADALADAVVFGERTTWCAGASMSNEGPEEESYHESRVGDHG